MRSYRTVSPLPHLARAAVCFLWHFPSSHPDWPLASTLPYGARTFLDEPWRAAATTPPAPARSGESIPRDGGDRRGAPWRPAEPASSAASAVLHQIFPVDDPVTVGAGFDGAALKQLYSCGGMFMLQPCRCRCARPPPPGRGGCGCRYSASARRAARPRRSCRARRAGRRSCPRSRPCARGPVAVLLDRLAERLDLGGAFGQNLLLGLDGFDQLGDLRLAAGQPSRRYSVSRWAATYSFVFLACASLCLAPVTFLVVSSRPFCSA